MSRMQRYLDWAENIERNHPELKKSLKPAEQTQQALIRLRDELGADLHAGDTHTDLLRVVCNINSCLFGEYPKKPKTK